MEYVDGFVVPVPAGNKDAYREMAVKFAPLFKEFGALRMVECWGDEVPEGEVTSFPMAVRREADETVLFSWMEFPDKAAHDACMEKSFADPRMRMDDEMPRIMDPRRMIFGGFDAILDL